MKKVAIPAVLLMLAISPLYSQLNAVIKEVSGKVTVGTPQSGWQPAKIGMRISAGTYISTGFNSMARLELGPTAMWVEQLTRMELRELARKENRITTALQLNYGSVRAEIKTAEGLHQDFKLRSAVGTAAVRGTAFEFDGEKIKVLEGIMTLTNRVGQKQTVLKGEESRTTAYEKPVSPEKMKIAKLKVMPYTSRTKKSLAKVRKSEPDTTTPEVEVGITWEE